MPIMEEFFELYPGFIRAEALPVTASNRKYYRLFLQEGSVIGVSSGNVAENDSFIAMSRFFRAKGLRVPEILACSGDGRCYVQQDLGEDSLRSHLDDNQLLCTVVRELVHIQFAGRDFDYSQCFATREFGLRPIMFDLNYFKYCFLKPWFSLSGCLDLDENRLQDDFEAMCADLLDEPSDTFLYRDFQSRNVMVKEGQPWYIDFQGGYRGPIYYDLCSFVYQASAGFTQQQRRTLIDAYYDELQRFRTVPRERCDEKVGLFALFRCLQTLGAYGFRGLFEKKQYFISSIPAGLANLKALATDKYPYIKTLAYEFDSDNI